MNMVNMHNQHHEYAEMENTDTEGVVKTPYLTVPRFPSLHFIFLQS